MSRYEVIERVKGDIKNIDIATLISKHMKLIKNGSNLTGICPFHSDERVGNFFIDRKANRYKCFACGESGDAVDFITNFYQIGFSEAVVMIGQDFSLISIDEYDKYFSEDSKRFEKRKPKFKPIPKKRQNKLVETADIQIRDLVYRVLLSKLNLSNSHLDHLLSKRCLSHEIIRSSQYKSLNTDLNRSKILKEVVEELELMGYDKKNLIGVPGFFVEKGFYKMDTVTGLAWPIKNADGLIEAIQVRRDVKNKGISRYVWFTSSFATNINLGQSHGSSPSQPLDVTYPKTKKIKKVLIITEGKFKAEVIADKFKLITISVQGVTNWAGISETISDIEKIIGFKFDKVMTAFDADTSFKYQVFEQLEKMTNDIKDNHTDKEILYLLWDYNLGKGIDDLVLSGELTGKNIIKKLSKHKVDSKYGKELEYVKKEQAGEKLHDLKQKAISRVFKTAN